MTVRSTYTIEAQDLPTKAFSVTIEEPSFATRIEAAKRLPTNPEVNPGFSLEQAMLAFSIREINGKPIQGLRDPMDAIAQMTPKDVQALVSIFVSAFTLTDELAEQAKLLSEQMLKKPTPLYVIPKEEMPDQLFSVSFRRPTAADEITINKRYPTGGQPGYTREEMFMALCITHIDDKEVQQSKNIIDLISDWSHIDAQFVLGVFLNIAYMDQDDRSKAIELGKSLRKRKESSSSTSTTSSKAAVIATPKSKE